MKNLLVLFLILISSKTFAQLKVDAGKDTAICIWGFDTLKIGGNPTASGGIEPYVYAWSAKYIIGSNSYGASHFLDDSTFSNPKLVNPTLDYLKLKLIVTDNSGITAQDSITIRFSMFYYLLIECIDFINQGDTVTLSGNMGQGIGPLSYFWSPNYNISDTSAASPNVWPDTTVYYQVYAIDSIGCISEPSTCSIYVNTTGISPIYNQLIKSMVFPNPINSNSTIEINVYNTDKLTIKIVNSNGQTVLIDKFPANSYKIGNKKFMDGYYLYMIMDGHKTISYGRFIKN